MRIQTLSVSVGGPACNARCPFCISHMTGLPPRDRPPIPIDNFRAALGMAELGQTTTLLFTGKGEPTLYAQEITAYLDFLWYRRQERLYVPPLIEIQTNGMILGKVMDQDRAGQSWPNVPDTPKNRRSLLKNGPKLLKIWREMGLNTIAISAVALG